MINVSVLFLKFIFAVVVVINGAVERFVVLHFVVTSSAWGRGEMCDAGSRDLMFVNGRDRAVQVSVARACGKARLLQVCLRGQLCVCLCVFMFRKV